MKSDFQKSILTCFSLLLVMGFIAPSVLKLSHLLHGHFKEQGPQHGLSLIQKASLDCDFQKMKYSTQFYPALLSYTSLLKASALEISFPFMETSKPPSGIHFSLRAPPAFG